MSNSNQNMSFNNYVAVRYLGDLIPTGGRGTPVAPPTYIGREEKAPAFASAESHPVPDSQSGYRAYLTDDNGAFIHRRAVVINSLGAEAGLIEQCILTNSHRLGIELPGFYLTSENISDEQLEKIAGEAIKKFAKSDKKQTQYTASVLARALRNDLESANASNWTAAHRHVDSYIRHAEVDGKQIWENPESEHYQIISEASADKAEFLFRYFPGSALFGFWLSSVAQRRHKWARALSSTVIGYDAQPVSYGATKGDLLGGISTEVGLKRDPKTAAMIPDSSKNGKPSAVGLGLIPNTPTPQVFACDSILRRASISLTHLRHLQLSDKQLAEDFPQAAEQMAEVLAWLGIFGILAAAREGFLRSGCDLVTGKANSGFELVDFDGETTTFDIELEGAIDGFKKAYAALPDALKFAEPVRANFPEVIVTARALTLLEESNTTKTDKE